MVIINMSGQTLSLIVITMLVAIVGFFAYQLYFPKTGYTTYQGYSSYEEMMAAHHGPGASGGCSGVSVTNGEMSEYGISYDQEGYTKLVEMNNKISLTSDQLSKVIGLDVQIPCCDFQTLQASNNCECEHHLALYGLVKYLVSNGYDRNYIQSEINKWKEVYLQSNIGGCG